ncbi:MAG: hypothetical protein KA750_11095, partial [Thermoflexales bacterium]|nr:hypothetical protein [Thermoflexales bacterium]
TFDKAGAVGGVAAWIWPKDCGDAKASRLVASAMRGPKEMWNMLTFLHDTVWASKTNGARERL